MLRRSAVALCILTLPACEARPAWLGGPRPFALFGRDDMRPGIPLAKLQKAARSESRYPLQCQPLWAGAQRCVMPVSPGDLHAIVDSDGRLIRVAIVAPDSFFVWDDTPTMEPIYRYHANELKRAWDAIQPHEQIVDDARRGVEYRWKYGPRWGAQMWYSPWARYKTDSYLLREQYRDSLARVPDSIAVTDEPAYARLLAVRPPSEPAY